MYKHILVPTDGSNLSAGAVKAAAKLAHEFNAKLTSVHVIPPYTTQSFAEGTGPVGDVDAKRYRKLSKARAQQVLERAKKEAEAAHVTCSTTVVTAESPWAAIVEEARKGRCDLIVMASHGRRGLEGLLIGSETHKVLTHTKTPVLVCR
jgi:nucleotide-binding universal stress UspA family protein